MRRVNSKKRHGVGKPRHDRCKTMYTIVPQETRKKLSATDIQIFDIISSMCKSQGKKGRSGAWYCFPGEKWIAEKIGRSRERVSKSVQRLQRLRLIDITHRRKREGHWQTNMYRLSLNIMRGLGELRHWFSSVFHRVTQPSHIVQEPFLKQNENSLKEAFKIKKPAELEEIITRMEKLNPELA